MRAALTLATSLSMLSCGVIERLTESDSETSGEPVAEADAPATTSTPNTPTPTTASSDPLFPTLEPAAPPRPLGLAHRVGDGCAIRNSSLWCWASPWTGAELITGIAAPVSVADDCVLLESGAVVCMNAGKPVEIPALQGVTALSGWWRDLCGVKPDGTIVCSDRDGKVSEVAGITDAIDLAVGGKFACAIVRGGTVHCWGSNGDGELGRRPPLFGADKPQPAEVVDDVSGIVEIAASGSHVCARSQAGDVHCWGEGNRGQTGDPDRSKVTSPTKVLANATAIAVGRYTSCALVAGELLCWGSEFGSHPAKFPGIAGAHALEIGELGCVMVEDERVQCWSLVDGERRAGNGVWRHPIPGARVAKPGVLGPIVLNSTGQLQFFDPGWVEELPELASLTGLQEFDVEERTLCTIDGSGARRCWNRGWGLDVEREWARADDEPALHAIAVWRDRGCGITAAGKLACWKPDEPPTLSNVGNLLGKFVDAVAVGHRCVIDVRGKSRCAGTNDEGELGQGHARSTNKQHAPKRLGAVVEIDSDQNFTCARTRAGGVWCWGGEFPHEGRPRPPHDVGVVGAVQIAVGNTSACARDAAGSITCWREWVDWEQEPPMAVSDPPTQPEGFAGVASDIRMSGDRLCAVFGDEVRCWSAPHAPAGTLPIEVKFGPR